MVNSTLQSISHSPEAQIEFRRRQKAQLDQAHNESVMRKAFAAKEKSEEDLKAVNAEIAAINAEIAAINAEIAEKDAEITAINAEIAEKDAALLEKDAEIAELRAKIAELIKNDR